MVVGVMSTECAHTNKHDCVANKIRSHIMGRLQDSQGHIDSNCSVGMEEDNSLISQGT